MYRNNFENFPRVNGIQNDVTSLLGNSTYKIDTRAFGSRYGCYELYDSLLACLMFKGLQILLC